MEQAATREVDASDRKLLGISYGVLVFWALGLTIAALAIFIAGRVTERLQIGAIVQRGNLELDRYAGSLDAELGRFDYLPAVIGLHPQVTELLNHPESPVIVEGVNRYLEKVNGAAGANALYVVDPKGKVLASSNWDQKVSFVGIDVSFRPYFQEAIRGQFGRFFGIGTTSGIAGYYFARPIPYAGPIEGVGVVKLDLDHLQASWGNHTVGVMVVDRHGIVVLASQPEWRYHTIAPLNQDDREQLGRTRQFAHANLTPISLNIRQGPTEQSSIVNLPAMGQLKARPELLLQQRVLPSSGWKIMLLSDLNETNTLSGAVQIIVGLTAISLVLLMSYWSQLRKTAAAERGAKIILEEANDRLEREVVNRTRDLRESNTRLQETQDELVHSTKLAALGQLAVGITHEMNQPLAAIRNLSDNALTLLKRSETSVVADNLAMISNLTRRMARMNGKLKLFARKSPPSFTLSPVVPSLSNALTILSEKASSVHASIRLDAPEQSPAAVCDAARLEQVFVNLVANALDAVAGRPDPVIEIAIAMTGKHVVINIGDNGPGLPEEILKHLFDPFFTTKSAGEGLGLGLTISEGIVRDFGGTLTASNRPEGGASFKIQLPRSLAQEGDGNV